MVRTHGGQEGADSQENQGEILEQVGLLKDGAGNSIVAEWLKLGENDKSDANRLQEILKSTLQTTFEEGQKFGFTAEHVAMAKKEIEFIVSELHKLDSEMPVGALTSTLTGFINRLEAEVKTKPIASDTEVDNTEIVERKKRDTALVEDAIMFREDGKSLLTEWLDAEDEDTVLNLRLLPKINAKLEKDFEFYNSDLRSIEDVKNGIDFIEATTSTVGKLKDIKVSLMPLIHALLDHRIRLEKLLDKKEDAEQDETQSSAIRKGKKKAKPSKEEKLESHNPEESDDKIKKIDYVHFPLFFEKGDKEPKNLIQELVSATTSMEVGIVLGKLKANIDSNFNTQAGKSETEEELIAKKETYERYKRKLEDLGQEFIHPKLFADLDEYITKIETKISLINKQDMPKENAIPLKSEEAVDTASVDPTMGLKFPEEKSEESLENYKVVNFQELRTVLLEKIPEASKEETTQNGDLILQSTEEILTREWNDVKGSNEVAIKRSMALMVELKNDLVPVRASLAEDKNNKGKINLIDDVTKELTDMINSLQGRLDHIANPQLEEKEEAKEIKSVDDINEFLHVLPDIEIYSDSQGIIIMNEIIATLKNETIPAIESGDEAKIKSIKTAISTWQNSLNKEVGFKMGGIGNKLEHQRSFATKRKVTFLISLFEELNFAKGDLEHKLTEIKKQGAKKAKAAPEDTAEGKTDVKPAPEPAPVAASEKNTSPEEINTIPDIQLFVEGMSTFETKSLNHWQGIVHSVSSLLHTEMQRVVAMQDTTGAQELATTVNDMINLLKKKVGFRDNQIGTFIDGKTPANNGKRSLAQGLYRELHTARDLMDQFVAGVQITIPDLKAPATNKKKEDSSAPKQQAKPAASPKPQNTAAPAAAPVPPTPPTPTAAVNSKDKAKIKNRGRHQTHQDFETNQEALKPLTDQEIPSVFEGDTEVIQRKAPERKVEIRDLDEDEEEGGDEEYKPTPLKAEDLLKMNDEGLYDISEEAEKDTGFRKWFDRIFKQAEKVGDSSLEQRTMHEWHELYVEQKEKMTAMEKILKSKKAGDKIFEVFAGDSTKKEYALRKMLQNIEWELVSNPEQAAKRIEGILASNEKISGHQEKIQGLEAQLKRITDAQKDFTVLLPEDVVYDVMYGEDAPRAQMDELQNFLTDISLNYKFYAGKPGKEISNRQMREMFDRYERVRIGGYHRDEKIGFFKRFFSNLGGKIENNNQNDFKAFESSVKMLQQNKLVESPEVSKQEAEMNMKNLRRVVTFAAEEMQDAGTDESLDSILAKVPAEWQPHAEVLRKVYKTYGKNRAQYSQFQEEARDENRLKNVSSEIEGRKTSSEKEHETELENLTNEISADQAEFNQEVEDGFMLERLEGLSKAIRVKGSNGIELEKIEREFLTIDGDALDAEGTAGHKRLKLQLAHEWTKIYTKLNIFELAPTTKRFKRIFESTDEEIPRKDKKAALMSVLPKLEKMQLKFANDTFKKVQISAVMNYFKQVEKDLAK
ncbi:MAG: hypothetical protein V4576_03545 [Patescibacteria group bacterium]